MTGCTGAQVAETIIAMERAALDRWTHGDPDGFLEISDPDVVYFDPFLECRLNGLPALEAVYGSIRGQIQVDRYEMIDPRVEASDDMALLTFNFVSHSKAGIGHWNTTEVYRRRNCAWRIIHTHWSLTKPQLAAEPQP